MEGSNLCFCWIRFEIIINVVFLHSIKRDVQIYFYLLERLTLVSNSEVIGVYKVFRWFPIG